jgi:hypothetical protein
MARQAIKVVCSRSALLSEAMAQALVNVKREVAEGAEPLIRPNLVALPDSSILPSSAEPITLLSLVFAGRAIFKVCLFANADLTNNMQRLN